MSWNHKFSKAEKKKIQVYQSVKNVYKLNYYWFKS